MSSCQESITLNHIIDETLVESGQFITGDLSCIGFDKKRFFNAIVMSELNHYERYRPLTFRFNRYADQHANGQAAVFFSKADSTGIHDGSHDAGNIFTHRVGVFNRDPGMVPKWISEVVPVNTLSSAGILYLLQETRFHNTSENSILHEPRTFLWHYEGDCEHGILYTTETGNMDITAHYEYPVTEMVDSNGVLIDAELHYINDGKDKILMDLIVGKFLISLGRSRRAFTLNNSPINFDASELVAEGQELVNQATQELYNQSNWYDALGT